MCASIFRQSNYISVKIFLKNNEPGKKKKTTQETQWLFANPFRLDFYSILYGEEKQFIICAQSP